MIHFAKFIFHTVLACLFLLFLILLMKHADSALKAYGRSNNRYLYLEGFYFFFVTTLCLSYQRIRSSLLVSGLTFWVFNISLALYTTSASSNCMLIHWKNKCELSLIIELGVKLTCYPHQVFLILSFSRSTSVNDLVFLFPFAQDVPILPLSSSQFSSYLLSYIFAYSSVIWHYSFLSVS